MSKKRKPKKVYYCTYCNKPFERYQSTIKNEELVFCCVEHKNLHAKETGMFKGENNPNYDNRWAQEKKDDQSRRVKERMKDPEVRWKTGSANRGKKFSDERIERMHGHRPSESYSHPHTKEKKKDIGIKSREKFKKPGFVDKFRKTMEERGFWIQLAEKSDWEIYQKESNWIERMFDRCNKEEENLLKEHGVFNNKTNTKGVVRDHIFSRKSGFLNGVFPELLRHPTNCQIVTHSYNVKKKSKRYVDKDNMTLEELFIAIRSYVGSWIEQEICLEIITQYENGKRWKRRQ